jgi:hypothetical protein
MSSVLVIGLIVAFLCAVILLEAGDVIFASPEKRKAARRAAKMPVLIVPSSTKTMASNQPAHRRMGHDIAVPLLVAREPTQAEESPAVPDTHSSAAAQYSHL